MRHGPVSFLLILLSALALTASPAQAQSGAVVGAPLVTCVAPVRSGDQAAAMFAMPARFDCTAPQTRLGTGDFWVLTPSLIALPDRSARTRVRIGSVWQASATLYALYPGGMVRGWRYDGRATPRHVQLGAMIEWALPPTLGAPQRLLWRIEGSANLRGIVVAPTLATPAESDRSDLTMAALYAGFGGLCLALLIYNLAMWGALRHRFQLAYCAMVACLALYAFSSSGALAWAWPGIANNDRLRINYALLASAAITAILFARSFFPPSVTRGWVGRLCSATIAAATLATIALVVAAPWHMRWLETGYSLSFAAMMLVTAPIIWRARGAGSPHLWLFAVAWAVPIGFAALRLLGNLSLLPWSFWLDNSTILSMTFEAVMSAVAIAYRLRLLAVERDAAIEREVIAARLADTDPLTGLFNRRALLRQAIERGGEQALILADLDHFKRVNETLGHDGGDEVLRLFARILRQASPADALIARMGGEEFAILMPAERTVAPDDILARLRAARMPFDITVTASIGAAGAPLHDEAQWRALYRRADRALFDAKQGGRDRARTAA